MNLNEIRTRRQLISILASEGITGAAAEAIVCETAPARHAMRVAEAKKAALAEVERLFGEGIRKKSAQLVDSYGEDGCGESWIRGQLCALAALFCLLETAGIGGKDGVDGAGTARMACFSSLGKGRKHARDGAAWCAAIAQAAEELVPGCYLYAPNGEVCLGISNIRARASEEELASTILTPQELRSVGLASWAMTIAREGLRLTCGLQPWLGYKLRFHIDREWSGCGMKPAEAWAQLVNQLAAPVVVESVLEVVVVE